MSAEVIKSPDQFVPNYQVAIHLEWQGDHLGSRALLLQLAEETKHPGNLALLYCDIGLTYRMENDYSNARIYFSAAYRRALEFEDQERRLGKQPHFNPRVEVNVGLMDLSRTQGRDKSGHQQNDLLKARKHRSKAAELLKQLPEGPSVTKVNFYINSALLNQDLGYAIPDKRRAKRLWRSALKDINIAEDMCRELADDPNQQGNEYVLNRLRRVTTVKGITLELLGQWQEAIDYQKDAYQGYEELKDVRGMGNAAMSAGRICQKHDMLGVALDWYKKALEVASRTNADGAVVDPTIAQGAQAAIDQLTQPLSL